MRAMRSRRLGAAITGTGRSSGFYIGGGGISVSGLAVVDVQVRKLALEGGDLGKVVEDDVRAVGIVDEVVLMIVLGAVEGFERDDLGDDGVGEGLGCGELVHVSLGDALLVGSFKEDRRAILGADVRPLAVELSGIVGDGEEDFQ